MLLPQCHYHFYHHLSYPNHSYYFCQSHYSTSSYFSYSYYYYCYYYCCYYYCYLVLSNEIEFLRRKSESNARNIRNQKIKPRSKAQSSLLNYFPSVSFTKTVQTRSTIQIIGDARECIHGVFCIVLYWYIDSMIQQPQNHRSGPAGEARPTLYFVRLDLKSFCMIYLLILCISCN